MIRPLNHFKEENSLFTFREVINQASTCNIAHRSSRQGTIARSSPKATSQVQNFEKKVMHPAKGTGLKRNVECTLEQNLAQRGLRT